MGAISKAYESLLEALKVVAMAVVFIVFLLILADVIMSVFTTINKKLQWFDPSISAWDGTHGYVEYGMLWFTMLAAPWLARHKGHVYIDAVTELLSPSVRKFTSVFAYLVAIVVSAFFTYYSWTLLKEAYLDELIDERGVDMAQWLLYLPMPICFGLLTIEFIRFLLGFDDMFDKRLEERGGM